MIIFAKADGQVINTQPTPVYQGSSLKGSVYLVAPFAQSNGVTIQFQLPNGNVTKAYPMTPTGNIEGVTDKLGDEMSIWVWNVANAMVTNFQLPESTQLMMICAFGGYDLIMHAYDVAAKEGYRFGTYGDAMLIL